MYQKIEYQWDRSLSFAHRDSSGTFRTDSFDSRVVVESPVLDTDYVERAFAAVDSVLDWFDESLILYRNDEVFSNLSFDLRQFVGPSGRFIVVPYWPEVQIVVTHLLWELRRRCPAPVCISRLHMSGVIVVEAPSAGCDFAESIFSRDLDEGERLPRRRSIGDERVTTTEDGIQYIYTNEHRCNCERCNDHECGL